MAEIISDPKIITPTMHLLTIDRNNNCVGTTTSTAEAHSVASNHAPLQGSTRTKNCNLNAIDRGSGGCFDGLSNFTSSYHQEFQNNVHRISYCNRLCVPDPQSSRKFFLVDTGADVSIIPSSTIQKNIQNANRHTLFAANSTEIKYTAPSA